MPRPSRSSLTRHGLRLGVASTAAVLAATLTNGAAVATPARPHAASTTALAAAPAAAVQPAVLPVAGSRLHRVNQVTGSSTSTAARAGTAAAAVAPALAPVTAAATLSRADFNALAPVKTLDTRTGLGTPKARLAAGRTITVPIAGRFGVPATGVAGVLMTVTAVAPTAPGYLSVYPAGVARPSTVTLNFATGQTVSNLTLAQLNSAGQVTIFNSGGLVDVTATLSGWYSTTATVHPLTPARLLDTRFGTGAPVGAIPLNGTRVVQVTGRGGVPATGVTAAVVNLTTIGATKAGSMALYPTGSAPGAGTVTVPSNAAISNLAYVRLGTGGALDVINRAGSAHAVIDVQGWIGAGGQFHPLSERRWDTRPTVDGGGPLPDGFFFDFKMTGVGRVPAYGVNALTMNITIVSPTANGQLVVEPQGISTPAATTISYTAGRTTSTLIQVKIGAGGWIRFDNTGGSINLILDTVGWYSADGNLGIAVGGNIPLTPLSTVDHRKIFGVSPDGRYSFFFESAKLAPYTDLNSLYVRDSLLGLTSVLVAGGFGANRYAFSDDARYLTFISTTPLLWPGDTNKAEDTFWYDPVTGDFTVATLASTGAVSNHGGVGRALSGNGRYVGFGSLSAGIAPNAPVAAASYVRDITTGVTTLIGQCAGSTALSDCVTAVSSDGSTALLPSDQPLPQSTGLWSRATGTVTPLPAVFRGSVYDTSNDLGTVLFGTNQSLVAADTNGLNDVYAVNTATQAFTLVDRMPGGAAPPSGAVAAVMTGDGSTVALQTQADLAGGGAPAVSPQAYVGAVGGPFRLVSRTAAGAVGNGDSLAVAVSANGAYVAWGTRATNLGGSNPALRWLVQRVK